MVAAVEDRCGAAGQVVGALGAPWLAWHARDGSLPVR